MNKAHAQRIVDFQEIKRVPLAAILERYNIMTELKRIGTQHFEPKVFEVDRVATFGHVAELFRDEAANRVGGCIGKVGGKRGVEFGDLGERLDPVTPVGFRDDMVGALVASLRVTFLLGDPL